MPPKKEKKKDSGSNENADSPEAQLNLINFQNTTLILQLRERTEVISDCIEAKRSLEKEVIEINDQFSSSKNRTRQITHEMTRQFETMQEQLVDKISLLSRTVQDLKDNLEAAEEKYEKIENERDLRIAQKDEDILALQAKMDDMAVEFGDMLNGTLEKMRERIELSNTNSFDVDSGARMQRKVGT